MIAPLAAGPDAENVETAVWPEYKRFQNFYVYNSHVIFLKKAETYRIRTTYSTPIS